MVKEFMAIFNGSRSLEIYQASTAQLQRSSPSVCEDHRTARAATLCIVHWDVVISTEVSLSEITEVLIVRLWFGGWDGKHGTICQRVFVNFLMWNSFGVILEK